MAKEYRTEQIVVHWDAARCIHTAICTRGLPAVFDAARRPWITAGGAGPDDVATVVAACPTGALRYERLDGGPAEEVPDVTTVVPVPNGPLFVRGPLRVQRPDGTIIAEESRLALCRCGASANQPFCDNSHRRSGFSSQQPPADAPPAAASPADVCEPQEL